MVYILEQRLQAQKIPEAKGQKVLSDVVRTMYYPRFIEELFKPQEMYSIQSTRQIFDRLAHSSIMRLNESSMDKLFDLMAMGFKYQIISCTAPHELLDITQNHLGVLKRLVGSTASVLELVDECIRLVQVAYSGMSLAEFNALRQSLCRFFQDRKVKVSLFLHDQTQNSDGSIVVPSSGTLPATCQFAPGTIRYFQGGQEVSRGQLNVVGATAWQPTSGLRTQLGGNVYEKDRSDGPAATPPPAPLAPLGMPMPAEGTPLPAPAPVPLAPGVAAKAAVGELNFLASLIGSQSASGHEHFKLESLFSSNIFGLDAGSHGAEVIQIDSRGPNQHRDSLEAIRNQMDFGGPVADADESDLLDLMDNA